MDVRQSPACAKRRHNQWLNIGVGVKRDYALPQRIRQVGFAFGVKPGSWRRWDGAERISHGLRGGSRAASNEFETQTTVKWPPGSMGTSFSNNYLKLKWLLISSNSVVNCPLTFVASERPDPAPQSPQAHAGWVFSFCLRTGTILTLL